MKYYHLRYITLLLLVPCLSFSQNIDRMNTVYGEILGSSLEAGVSYERLFSTKNESIYLNGRFGFRYVAGSGFFLVGFGSEFGRNRSRFRVDGTLDISSVFLRDPTPIERYVFRTYYVFRGWNGFHFNTGLATWYEPDGYIKILPLPGVSFGYSF